MIQKRASLFFLVYCTIGQVKANSEEISFVTRRTKQIMWLHPEPFYFLDLNSNTKQNRIDATVGNAKISQMAALELFKKNYPDLYKKYDEKNENVSLRGIKTSPKVIGDKKNRYIWIIQAGSDLLATAYVLQKGNPVQTLNKPIKITLT